MRKQCLLHEVLTDTTYGAADLSEFKTVVSRSLTVDFILFSLFIFILLYFTLLFLFLFLEQLRLGFISHAVTSVTN